LELDHHLNFKHALRWPGILVLLVLTFGFGHALYGELPSPQRPSGSALLRLSPVVLDSSLTGSPTIILSVDSGTPGTAVTITGTGFPPNEIVALYIDLPGPYLDIPGPRADAQGGFTKDIVWPSRDYDATGRVNPSAAGAHNVCGDTGNPGSSQPLLAKACAPFTVLAVPSPSSTAASATRAPASPWPVVVGLFLIFVAIAIGVVVWIRRSE